MMSVCRPVGLALAGLLVAGSGAACADDLKTGSSYQASSISSSNTFKGGTLVLNSTATVTSKFDVQSYSTNTIDIDGNAVTMSGAFTDNGPLIFTDSVGGGNVILTNSGNTLSGLVTINSGAMVSLSGSGVLTSSSITDNGTFDISATTAGASIVSLAGNGTVNLGSQTLTITGANTSFSGTLTGGGGLVLSGGTEEISGSNTYTGGTTIKAGTLEVGDATTNGSITGNVTLNTAGVLEFNRSDMVSFSGMISGTGSVTQLGVGTTVLTAINSYSGATTITNGTLALSGVGSIGQSPVTDNAIFDISATSGASIASLGGTGTVNLGSATLTVSNGSSTFSGVIAGSGGLTVSGGNQTLSGNNTYTGPTTVTGGTLTFAQSSVANNVADSGTVGFNSTSAIAYTGVISGTGALAQAGTEVTTISVAQAYSGPTTITAGTLALSGAGSIASSSGVAVAGIFDISATSGASITALSGSGGVVLGGNTLTITNGTGVFSGIISGSGGVIVTGGNQIFAGTNSYSGPTLIAGGTLALTNPQSLAVSSDVTDNGTLDLSQVTSSTGPATYLISIGGTGSVMLGVRTLILTAAKDTFAGVISGTGGFTINGGTETFTGANNYTGVTTIAAGALALAGSGSLAGADSVSDNGIFDISAANAEETIGSLAGKGTVNLGAQTLNIANGKDTFSGAITGTGGLIVSGGNETLTGANTYSGLTTIAGGTLAIGHGGSIAGNVMNNGTLGFVETGTYLYPGVISGTGAVVQTGTGTTILTGANTYTGGTSITAGMLQIGNGGASGAIGGNVTDNGTLAFGRSDQTNFGGTISGAGGVSVLSGTLVLTAADSYSGGTVIASSASLVLAGSGSIAASTLVTDNGTFDVSSISAPQTGALAGGGTVALGGQTLTIAAGSGNFSGVLSGTGGLTVNGGSQTLAGTNGYGGATTINGGTLTVNGSILKSSGITVNSGGTLAGSGSVPSVSVNNGGSIAAGSGGAGTLSVNGSVAFASGATLVVNTTSASAGLVSVSGAAPLAGVLSIASMDGSYPLGQKLTVLTAAGGVSGTFALQPIQTSGAQYASALSYDANDVYLEINLAKLSPLLLAGATRNQSDAVAGIDAGIAAKDSLPSSFNALAGASSATLAADASQFSSQIGAEVAQEGRALFVTFVDSISGHIADMQSTGTTAANRLRPGTQLWGDGFAGSRQVAGDPNILGTGRVSSSLFGFAGGADWALSPNLRLGGAISAGASDFHISDAASTGRAEAIQIAGYGLLQMGPRLYNSFAGVIALDNTSTSRVVTASETDDLNGKLRGLLVGLRYEAGAQFRFVAPYAAFDGDLFHMPAYSEKAAGGADSFALAYPAQSNENLNTELGIRQRAYLVARNWTLMLSDRIAWSYDMSGTPQADESYAALPDSRFLAYGGSRPKNSLLLSLGAAQEYRSGFGLDFRVDDRLSGRDQFFNGTAGLSFSW